MYNRTMVIIPGNLRIPRMKAEINIDFKVVDIA